MRLLILLFSTVFLINCSENDHLDVSDLNNNNTVEPSTNCDQINYLIPQINEVSRSADMANPYEIVLEDNSISTGTIVSRQWEIEDVRDFLSVPGGAGCTAEPDCRYTGSSPTSSTGATFTIPDVGTLSTSGDHDDFLVKLTVEDSNGLRGEVKYLYVSFALGPKLITSIRLTNLSNSNCEVSVTVDTFDFRDDVGSNADDVTLDVSADGSYESENNLVGVPFILTYDYGLTGNYFNSIIVESDSFDPSMPDRDNLYFIRYGLGLSAN